RVAFEPLCPHVGFEDRPMSSARFLSRLVLGGACVGVVAFALTPPARPAQAQPIPVIEHEEKSEYSRIRVTRGKNVRTLWFVRDSGEAIVESMVDVDKPHELLVEYTRYMFTSYLFRPKQEKVLIIGLGGGAMVHFLKHYDAQVKVDVVEIDPAVVKVADKFFGVRSGGDGNVIHPAAFRC